MPDIMRAASEFDGAPWRALPEDRLTEAAAVPTMLARDERRFYHWIGSEWTRDRGAVVDLGSFVGGSTALMASGLARTGRSAYVHAFDRFRVSESVKAKHLIANGVPPFGGDDMMPLARRLLAPWADRVVFRRGEILDQTWTGGPVEVALIDAAKTPALTDHIAAQIFPALVPGALIVQQDFLHWSQPWIAAQMLGLGDAVVPVAHARPDTIAYLTTREITADDVAAARTAGLTDADLDAALAATRPLARRFGVAPRIARMREGLRLNPGVRTAWRMRNVPA